MMAFVTDPSKLPRYRVIGPGFDIGIFERKGQNLRGAARAEGPLHHAADRHVPHLSVALRYAFAVGRKKLRATRDANVAANAVKVALTEVLEPSLVKAVVAGGRAGVKALSTLRTAEELRTAAPNLKMSFDATNPDVVKWARKHAAELIDDISATSKKRIRLAISELHDEGDWDLALDRILASVGDEQRAKLIARTESMAAASEGNRQGWRQAIDEGLLTGDEKVTWIATEGACPECEALDGAVRDIDGQYPDPGGDGPILHPNCRCTEGIIG